MARTAENLHAEAVEFANRGRLTSAKGLLDRAAARTEDVDLQARIAGTLAYILAQTGELAAAEARCLDALRLSGITGAMAAVLAGQMGALAERAGRLDDAEEWLARGIAGVHDEPITRAHLLMNRCLLNIQRRRLDEATRDANDAARLYRSHGLPFDEAQAIHNVGYVDLLRGDLVTALQSMMQARRILADVSPVVTATIDLDRAEVLRDAGLTTDAERILARTASAFGANRMPQARAEAELNLARSLLAHEPREAARVAGAAARRFRTLGNETWAARAEAVRLRAALSSPMPADGASSSGAPRPTSGRRIPAATEVETTASELDRRGFRSEAAALRMSHELWRARQGSAAGRTPGTMPTIRVPATASMDVRLLAHEVRAARAAAAGHDAQTRKHAAAGLDTLGRWQSTFGSIDLQTSIGMHGSGLVYAGLASAVRSRRPDVLFEWAERARHLSQQVVPLRPPPDPAFAADLAELRMRRADDPTGAWLRDPRAATLQERARERQWSSTGAVEFQHRASLPQLREALDADTALLSYVYSGETMTALVVTRDREAVVNIDRWREVRQAMSGLRADLDMSASVRMGPMAAVVRRSLDARLVNLSAALLDRPAEIAGTRRLVITAPGVLSPIPWAMLPGIRGRAFTVATSATRWLHQHEHEPAGRVAFAAGPRVPRGIEEVDAAAAAWAHLPGNTVASVLRGDDATVDAVADLGAATDILHIAAHGRHALDNPLFSGLELADGALFGYDIDRMREVPATVVLSACEVGRSSIRWGEEAVGMTRIWLHAGTRTVIAAPVVVADDVACELLGSMHEGLAAGAPPAEALAAASERTGLVAPFQAHGAGF